MKSRYSTLQRAVAFALVLGATCGAWATDYYWIGGGTPNEDGSYNWADGQNWSTTDGGAAAGSYPNVDTVYDNATFGSTVTVKISDSETVNAVTLNADVTFTGGKLTFYTGTFGSGGGKLTLQDTTLKCAKSNASSSIICAIDVPTNKTATIIPFGSGSLGLTISGAITGSGNLMLDVTNNTGLIKFDGADVSAFEGVIYAKGKVLAYATDYSKAKWIQSDSFSGHYPWRTSAALYQFGTYDGYLVTGEDGKRSSITVGSRNEDCTIWGSWGIDGGNKYRNGVIWAAESATLTLTMTNTYEVAITNGGTVAITDSRVISKTNWATDTQDYTGKLLGGSTSTSTSILFKNKGGYLTFTEAGDASLNAEILSKVKAPDAAAIAGFSVPTGESVTLDLSSYKSVFDSAKLGKKGAGALTLSGLDTWGDISVSEGTLTIPTGLTVGALSIEEGATLAVDDYLTPGTTFLTATGDFGGTKITVKGIGLAGVYDGETYTTWSIPANTYHWTGGGTDNNWTTSANWGLSGGYPGQSNATVVFDNSASVIVAGTISNIRYLYLKNNSIVTFSRPEDSSSNGTISGMYSVGYEAGIDDKIVLNGVDLESVNMTGSRVENWYCDIEVGGTSSVTNWIMCRIGDNETSIKTLAYRGNLTGSGNLGLRCTNNSNGRGGVSLYGDNSGFRGECVIYVGYAVRCPYTFCSATSGSEHAKWIYASGVGDGKGPGGAVAVASDTVKFGTYEGSSYIYGSSSFFGGTIEIGALNTDFTCALCASSATGAERANNYATLKKVGSGTMTLNELSQKESPCFVYYVMANGTLKMNAANILTAATGRNSTTSMQYTFSGGAIAFGDVCVDSSGNVIDISSKIVNSDYPIVIDVAEGQSITWGTALANTNTRGLIKKGAGTLTLSKAPALAGFPLTVEEGALIVPSTGCTIGFNTKSDDNWSSDEDYVSNTLRLIPDSVTEVAYIGTTEEGATKYASVQEALNAASGTEVTITLLANANGSLTIPAGTTLTVNANGKLFGCTLSGGGTLAYQDTSSAPSTYPCFASDWTGTVVIGWSLSGAAADNYDFNRWGIEGSTIEFAANFTGHQLNSTYATLPTIRIDSGKVFTLDNGWKSSTPLFKKVTGEGTFAITFNHSGTDQTEDPVYTIETLENFGGILSNKVVTAKRSWFKIGNIAMTSVPGYGVALVKVGQGFDVKDMESTTLNGETANLCIDTVSSQKGIYKTAATVTVGATTTKYATVANAIAGANAIGAYSVLVYDTDSVSEYENWQYDSETHTYTSQTKVAKAVPSGEAEEQEYTSLQAAINAVAENGTVTLIANCSENVALPLGKTVDCDTYAYVGTISGGGTLVINSKPTIAPSYSNWTGTVKIAWDVSTETNGKLFDFNLYGVTGSKVTFAGNYKGYTSNFSTYTVNPTIVIAAEKTFEISNGSGGSTITFTKVTGEGDFTISFYNQGSSDSVYIINTLEDFSGKLTTRRGYSNHTYFKIVNVTTPTSWLSGDAIIKTGTVCDFKDLNQTLLDSAATPLAQITTGDNLGVYKAVASVTISDTLNYYRTVDDAISAANTAGVNTITLLDEDASTSNSAWGLDSGSYRRYVAQVEGGDKYFTVQLAANAANGAKVTTIAASSDALSIAANSTIILDASTYAFTGEISGGATAVLSLPVKPKNAPTMATGWTGTVVVDFASASGGFAIDSYGNANSTVEFNKSMTGHFMNAAGNGNPTFVGTLKINQGVTITLNNGWPGSGANVVSMGTLTGAGNLTYNGDSLNWNDGAYLTFSFASIANYTGTLTIGTHFKITITAVAVDTAPVAYKPYAKVTIAGEGRLSDIDGTIVKVGGVETGTELTCTTIDAISGLYAVFSSEAAAEEAAEAEVTSEVAEILDTAEKVAAYQELFEGTATETSEGSGKYVVTAIAFTSAAESAIHADVDTAFASIVASAGEEDAQITVATKPGLYYSIEYGDSASSLSVSTTPQLGDGEPLTIPFNFPAGGESSAVRYYKVKVSPTH